MAGLVVSYDIHRLGRDSSSRGVLKIHVEITISLPEMLTIEEDDRFSL
jgi:hypothetical protein